VASSQSGGGATSSWRTSITTGVPIVGAWVAASGRGHGTRVVSGRDSRSGETFFFNLDTEQLYR